MTPTREEVTRLIERLRHKARAKAKQMFAEGVSFQLIDMEAADALSALLDENERLKRDCEAQHGDLIRCNQELLDAANKNFLDAERYRWFRDSGRECWPSYREGNTYRKAKTCDEADAAIDEAMKK